MSLNNRVSKLEAKTIREYKGIKYDLSALATEELKYMLTIEDWEMDIRANKIFNKIKY